MIPAYLITLREAIEASLIVATFAGILTKLGKKNGLNALFGGALLATFVSVIVVITASIIGIQIQRVYSGSIEAVTEGVLYIFSAIFVTYAVFFLHKHFAGNRVRLIRQMQEALSVDERRGLFLLAFSLVLREGIEIALFLSTTFLSDSPVAIITGCMFGLATGIVLSMLMIVATIRIPVYTALRTTTFLIILFAAGLLSQGIHELTEAGVIPATTEFTLSVLHQSQSGIQAYVSALFGVTPIMNTAQIATYIAYVVYMMVYLSWSKKKLTFEA